MLQQRHPEVEGLASGAVLSTYQRTRVESVCARLGLTSLAYLWQVGVATSMLCNNVEALILICLSVLVL